MPNNLQVDINAIPRTTKPAPIMLTVLILSPKMKNDNSAINNIHPPENAGYAMLSSISLSALVKKKTLIPPNINPEANSPNQRMVCCLFEIFLYKR